MESFSLTCNDKKVWSFYKDHPNLDFESMNIIFVNILESLSQDINSSLSNSIAMQLLNNMKGIQAQLHTFSDNVNKLHSDTLISLTNKLNESKKDYLEDMKLILSTNTTEKLAPLIKEYNTNTLDKTFIMINDIVPKNNDSLNKQIQEYMKDFYKSVTEDTNKLLKSTLNQTSLDDFIGGIDNKFMTAISNTQQIVNNIISSTEQRLDTRINDIKNSTEKHIIDIKGITSSNNSVQTTLQTNINELLKKMENSSTKGKYSENILFNILQSLYSTAQIDCVGEQKETGDIMLSRKNKPTILIENKNWGKNVVQDEVKKFIRDVELQNCCGLFLSQNHGIANKENFEININNGNILLYVHEVNNDAEKIKIAIDIIDNFKTKLDELVTVNGNGYNIDKDVLDEINKEYQTFASQKLNTIKYVKDFSLKMVKQIEDMQVPSLEQFLSTRYAFSSSKYVCEICQYVGKNQSAMSAHKRVHEKNNTQPPVIEPVQIDIPVTNPTPQVNTNITQTPKARTTRTPK